MVAVVAAVVAAVTGEGLDGVVAVDVVGFGFGEEGFGAGVVVTVDEEEDASASGG